MLCFLKYIYMVWVTTLTIVLSTMHVLQSLLVAVQCGNAVAIVAYICACKLVWYYVVLYYF